MMLFVEAISLWLPKFSHGWDITGFVDRFKTLWNRILVYDIA